MKKIQKYEYFLFIGTLIWMFGDLRNKILDVLVLLIWLLITFIMVYRNRENLVDIIKKYKFFYIFMAIAGLSILWAYDKKESFESIVYLVTMLNAFIYFCEKMGQNEILKTTNKVITFIIFINIIFLIFVPDKAIQTNWRGFSTWKGIYIHKNTLGRFAIISILIAIQSIKLNSIKIKEYFKKNNLRFGVFREELKLSKIEKISIIINIIVPIIFVIFSKSSTSLGVLLIIFGILLISNININKIVFSCGIVFIFAYHFIINNPISKYFIVDVLGRNLTLTGRTYIWEYTFDMIKKNPIFGYGYFHLWDSNLPGVQNVFERYGKVVSNAHNAFYDTFARIGILGFITLILIFVTLFIKAVKKKNIQATVLLIGILLINTFETAILLKNSYDFFALILIATVLLRSGEKYENFSVK